MMTKFKQRQPAAGGWARRGLLTPQFSRVRQREAARFPPVDELPRLRRGIRSDQVELRRACRDKKLITEAYSRNAYRARSSFAYLDPDTFKELQGAAPRGVRRLG